MALCSNGSWTLQLVIDCRSFADSFVHDNFFKMQCDNFFISQVNIDALRVHKIYQLLVIMKLTIVTAAS